MKKYRLEGQNRGILHGMQGFWNAFQAGNVILAMKWGNQESGIPEPGSPEIQ